MKRIAGSFLLLASLSGCMAVNGPPQPSAQTSTALKAQGTAQADARPAIPPPAYPTWSMDPAHYANGSANYVVRAAQPGPPAPLPPGLAASPMPMMPPSQQSMMLPPPSPGLPPPPAPVRLDDMPASLVPPVVTPPKPPEVVQASCTTPQEPAPVRFPGDRPEALPPIGTARTQIPVPPMPIVKETVPADAKPARGGPPLVRLVNTKRITLNFEVKDVGPSGLASVELWYTKDGRDWKKHDAPTKAKAYVVEVEGEGMYGFTLLARSGAGHGAAQPAPGDQPQVWVIVDLTRPEVHLTEVKASADQQPQLTVKWTARDRNLGHRPIALFWSETPEGPWKVMASNLENTGKYVWAAPRDMPPRFLVKVEATDLAGNVGSAQSPPPAVLDVRVPMVSIVGVESNGR
jgi:hypothetical protein